MFTTLTSWLRSPSRSTRRRPRPFGARLETLEDRTVMDSSYFPLANSAGTLSQDWTTNFTSWGSVGSFEGYDGSGLASSAGANPQTITATGGNITLANDTNPGSSSSPGRTPGGVVRFDISDPTVAFAGDAGPNQAPYILAYLNTVGTGDVTVAYTVRDIDGSSRNSASPVALQYRVSKSKSSPDFSGVAFTNVPAAFLADATVGGTTKSTDITVTLPSAVNEQPFVQIRWITARATSTNPSTDEWVGIDNIVIHGNMPPVIGINGTQLDYTENDPLTYVDPGMLLTDIDSADFKGGVLTVGYPVVGNADDRLIVNNVGGSNPLPGQISVSGSNVNFTTSAGTTTIGTMNANGGIGATPLVITFTSTTATLQAVQALLRDIGFLNVSDDPVGGIRKVQFQVSDGDGETSAVVSRDVNVIPVNDPPVITLQGGPVNVTEGDPAVLVDASATVTDPDSHDFDGGVLTVSLPTGATSFDFLTIQDQGTGANQVGVLTGTSQVTFSGVVVGTYSGGQNGAPLTVTFNPASTLQAVQAVVRAIMFQNTSENPPGNARPIRFSLTDGDGGTSPNVQVTVTILPVNNPPTLTPSRAGFLYTENDAPTRIDAGVTVADPDSPDFNTGTLTVDYLSGGQAEDRLTIRNQGTGIGQVGVNGFNVTYNFGSSAVNVGAITSSGSGTTKLQITFNPNATLAAVQAVLQNVTYANVSDNPVTTPRVVRFVLGDGDGGFSTAVSYTINVAAVNDAPTLGGISGTVSYKAGFPAVVLVPSATFTDPDSPTLNTGYLSVGLSGGLPADVIGIRNQGTGAGRIGTSANVVTYSGVSIGTFSGGTGGTPLTITFNANATPAAAQALLDSITFKTPNGSGVTGIRTLTFTALDFVGGAVSNAPTLNVDVGSTAGPNDDFYEVNEDFTLDVPANGVLANDSGGVSVNPALISGPTKGIVTLRADGSFTYVPNANENGTDTFTYQWSDVADTAHQALVTIVIDPVNDAPVANFASGTITVNEDSGVYIQDNFATFGPGGGLDEATQTLTKTITVDKPGLFALQPTIDSTGRLSFTPAPNANGTAVVSVALQDSGGTFNNPLDQDSATYTFTIVINAVNDAPNFQIIGNAPAVLEAKTAVQQSVTGFAFNFLPGPPTAVDEATQTPTYLITQIGNAGPQSPTGKLEFAVAPAIDAAGNLTYTPAAHSNGTATFIVQVRDSGGTAFGGVDTSPAKTFTITVTPVDDPPTAMPDTARVLWNTTGNAINVLANDSSFPDVGETITVVSATPGTHGGTITVAPGGGSVNYQPAPGFVGTETFTYTIDDGHGNTATATVTVDVIRQDVSAMDIVAVGAGPGGGSQVRLYDSKTGKFVAGFTAFDPSFTGGISIATGDVNGDGVTDIIIGAGAGGGPRVSVIDGRRIGLLKDVNQIADPSAYLANFFAYDWEFTGGVTVAAGDVNGDGKADVIVGTGPGGGPNVKVISGAKINVIGPDGLPDDSAILASFFAYDPSFRGGVNVATGDMNGDGYADVLTAAGAGGGAHVKAYDGRILYTQGALANNILLASFYAYDPSFRGGVTVAAGDFDGDGRAEYIVGAGAGGGSHVKVFSPFNLATPIASFFAFDPSSRAGISVGYRQRSGGASPLLLVGTGTGSDSQLIGFAAPDFNPVADIDAFDPGFTGGVSVG